MPTVQLTDAASIVGVGETAYTRQSGRSEPALAVEAINVALADAGIRTSDVDGLVAYSRTVPVEDIASVLCLRDLHFTGMGHMGGASSVEGLHLAALAIATGAASTVVLYCARNGSSGGRISDRVGGRLPGRQLRRQLELPHGWVTPAQWYATICRRHMHEHGTTKRQLGSVAVTMSEHAQRNPRALRHGRPITLDDYFAAPPIAEPFQRYDCCLESDGAAALVMAASDHAPGSAARQVRVSGIAVAQPESPDDITNRRDWFAGSIGSASERAFTMAGIGPEDMDCVMLYDCFTFEVIHQLEDAGFCEPGEGGRLAESGALRLTGRVPVNPHGGLLAEAHMLGLNHVNEAVRQLRCEAGACQVDRCDRVAVTGWGGMGEGAMAILRAANR